MSKKRNISKPLIAALISTMGLSACTIVQKTPSGTYYPNSDWSNPDAAYGDRYNDGEPMMLPDNEYAPFARAIFGYGRGIQDVYFDHYQDNNYRIRDSRGQTIAFMVRQPYGDYMVVNDFGRVLFRLSYVGGGQYRIEDPLGFHYGFLNYNYRGSFIAMDVRHRLYHNIFFHPLYYSWHHPNMYYRDHRRFKRRMPVSPPDHLINPTNDPEPRGNRRNRKLDDQWETANKDGRRDRRIRANQARSQSRADSVEERERILDMETEPRYRGTPPSGQKSRQGFKSKPDARTNQGKVRKARPMRSNRPQAAPPLQPQRVNPNSSESQQSQQATEPEARQDRPAQQQRQRPVRKQQQQQTSQKPNKASPPLEKSQKSSKPTKKLPKTSTKKSTKKSTTKNKGSSKTNNRRSQSNKVKN